MNIKQKITSVTIALLMVLGIATAVMQPAFAECKADPGTTCCGDVKVSILGDVCKGTSTDGGGKNSAIWAILILVLNILTAGVGIAAVGGIVYGAILYSSAGDKQDQTKKARGIITNTVVGLVAYGLMYLILNFLIPGGIFT
jgi:hypothetical protein